MNQLWSDIKNAAGVKDLDGLIEVETAKLQTINYNIIFNSTYGQFSFGPTTGSSQTPDLPGQALKKGEFYKDINVLAGYTFLDGLLFTPPWIRDNNELAKFFQELYPGISDDALDEIENAYPIPGDNGSGLSQRLTIMGVSNLLDDVSIQCNAYYLSEAILKANKPLSFSHRYILGASPPIHGSDLNYVFYPDVGFPGIGPADSDLANRIQRFWGNKIRFLDPNDDPDEEVWPVYDGSSRRVMAFGHFLPADFNWGLQDDPMGSEDKAKCDFWQSAPYYSGGKKDKHFVVQGDDRMEFK